MYIGYEHLLVELTCARESGYYYKTLTQKIFSVATMVRSVDLQFTTANGVGIGETCQTTALHRIYKI